MIKHSTISFRMLMLSKPFSSFQRTCCIEQALFHGESATARFHTASQQFLT